MPEDENSTRRRWDYARTERTVAAVALVGAIVVLEGRPYELNPNRTSLTNPSLRVVQWAPPQEPSIYTGPGHPGVGEQGVYTIASSAMSMLVER